MAMMFPLALALLAGLNGGMCIGKYSGLIRDSAFTLYFDNPSNVAIQELIGIFFCFLPIGALLMGQMADFMGRKWCLIVSASIITFGCFIDSQALLKKAGVSWMTIIAGRAVCGLGVGVILSLVPMYISEMARPEKRGVLENSFQFFIATGVFSDYAIQYMLLAGSKEMSEYGWKVCLAVQFPVALCFTLLAIVIPESPRWLAQREDACGVRRELLRLRSDHGLTPVDQSTLHEEVNMTMVVNKPPPAVAWLGLCGALTEKNSMIAVGLLIWINGSGIDTITQYCPEIFASHSGLTASDEQKMLASTLLMGFILVISTPLPLLIIDNYGRRPLLWVGAVGTTFSMAFLALGESLGLSADVHFTWRVTFVIAFIVAFNLGVVSVGGVVPPEILSSRVRSKVMAVGTAAACLIDYITVVTYLSLRESIGTAATFALYAVVNGFFATLALIYVPETMGCELDADTKGLLGAKTTDPRLLRQETSPF